MTTTVTKDDVVSLAAVDNGQAVSNTTKYTGEFEGTFQGTLVGGATTAKQLEKPYNFSLAGDATGTVAVNASSVILNTTVNHATKADTADFAGKTTLSARSTLADHSNTAEFAYRCGRLTKLFVTMSGAVVGSGSASDSDTINIDVERVNIADLFVVGKLAEKPDTSRIYADISGRHFWVYNNETGVWVDCYSQLASELDNHGVRISALENLDISRRLTTAEKDIDTLEGRADKLETRATNLEVRATSLEGRARRLENRADANDIEHADFEKRITKNTDDIASLDARVTSFETTSDVGQFATRMSAVENKNTEQDARIAELSEFTVTDATSVNTDSLSNCTGVIYKASDLISVSTDIDASSISNLSIADSEPSSTSLNSGSAVIYPSANSI